MIRGSEEICSSQEEVDRIMLDAVILTVIAVWFLAVVWRLIKKKDGYKACGGCTGSCAGCSRQAQTCGSTCERRREGKAGAEER